MNADGTWTAESLGLPRAQEARAGKLPFTLVFTDEAAGLFRAGTPAAGKSGHPGAAQVSRSASVAEGEAVPKARQPVTVTVQEMPEHVLIWAQRDRPGAGRFLAGAEIYQLTFHRGEDGLCFYSVWEHPGDGSDTASCVLPSGKFIHLGGLARGAVELVITRFTPVRLGDA